MKILITGVAGMTGIAGAFVERGMTLTNRLRLHVAVTVEAQLFLGITEQSTALRAVRTVTGHTLSKLDRRMHVDLVKTFLLLGMTGIA
jgi:hypothetical protein